MPRRKGGDHRSQGCGGDNFKAERDSKQERIWEKSIQHALEAISKAMRIFVKAEGKKKKKRIYISWTLFQTPGFQSLDQQADQRCLDWESWLFPADTVPAGILAEGNRAAQSGWSSGWFLINGQCKETPETSQVTGRREFIGRAAQDWETIAKPCFGLSLKTRRKNTNLKYDLSF